MRIALISTLARPVPPRGEGSVELLVHLLTEHLVNKGHDVTLFALPESQTSARLLSPVGSSYVDDPEKWDWQLYESFQVREAFSRWDEFDIINCHSYYYGLLFADMVPIPTLHSVHIEPGPDYLFLAQRTRNRHLQFCSQYQARDFAGLPGIHVIPHGTKMIDYAASEMDGSNGYLAWMGRFHPDKGIEAAIEVARQTGRLLKLAGPPNDYLDTVLRPQFSPGIAEYVGEIGGAEKHQFFAGAAAFLYPVERGEPFGLVLIEAMASGVPVVALDRGAVPEIVDDGVTGYLCSNTRQMMHAVDRVAGLERNRIRTVAQKRFSSERMGDALEKLMLEIVADHTASKGEF